MYLFSTCFDFWILNFSESGTPDRMHGAEEVSTTNLRNVGTWIPIDITLCPRGLENAAVLLWEPQITNYCALFLFTNVLLLLSAFIYSPFLSSTPFWRSVFWYRNEGLLEHTCSWIKIDQLDVTCFIISLFNAQHVSNVSISILRSLRLICWVISCVVLLWFDVWDGPC